MHNITVLGSGVMGHGIAQISATAGYNIVLRDIEPRFLEKAMEKIKWSLDKMISKGKINSSQAGSILSRIRPVVDIGVAVQDADMVIEAVPEIMTLKQKVYAELDEASDSGVIFASNTSTLPITEIAGATARPEKFIGIHFFNPPQLMKLVEVIPGQKTAQDTVDLTIEYVRSLRKEPILCRKDVPGFIVNRLFIPLVHEACHMLDRQKCTLKEVDSMFKFSLGFPMGIFELADFTGIDVIHKATEEMHSRDKKVINPHPMVEKMFNERNLGQKTGEGFYKYADGKYERVDLSREAADRTSPVQIAACLLNNAAWLVANDVSDMDEIERAASLGLGLKVPMRDTARRIGIDRIISELESMAKAHGEFYRPDTFLKSMA